MADDKSTSTTPREPTADECSANHRLTLDDGRPAMALWYPQMGGYVGKALATTDGGCIGLYVWHDGAFPFSAEGQLHLGEEPRSPAFLHLCSPDQFIHLGEQLVEFEESLPEE